MARLIDFIEESKWMKYKLIVEGEAIKLNLNKELFIDEDDITKQVVDHPRIFAFLSRIHKELVRAAKKADINRKRVRAKRIDQLVNDGESVTKAREKVEYDKIYLKAYSSQLNAEYKRDTLADIIEAFKQRKDLMQTLSANLRTEKQ